ncbi:28S ribosomal protein S29, mitochondrial-like [Mizuhopecten yessoensis]|uniref:Small ribosomal subunit protein mS29 n=1 Tax=Mizuhopecten yessoensis TaxID=6573 RepID=A0A210PRE6_MIZYE|nr:28S ribosomal protein S29, mitochondrial-like [Mizuhopecten yessoensis]OWF39034.1 28S ribosomal protein S29, mitochondrial [Mizuhopecten yessoensis]
MNTSVKVVLSSLLSRRLCTRPLHRVRQIQKSFLGTSSEDGSDPTNEVARPPVHRPSFADSLRKAREDAASKKEHSAQGSSSSESSSSSDSSEEDDSLLGKREPADLFGKSAKSRITSQDMFMTEQSDPSEHAMDYEGIYYIVSQEDQTRFFPSFIDSHYRIQARTFGGLYLMIRKPALEIIDIIKKSSYNCPLPKFIVYGKRGGGKTSTISHVMHYCGKQNHMLLNIPLVNDWIRARTNTTPSTSKAGFTNIPEQAQKWISHFAALNAPLIKDMKVTKSIEWTKKEVTEAGSPLQSLIDFGLLRQKYADDVVDMLLDEVMTCATENKFKVLLVIDGLNGFYQPTNMREPLQPQRFIHAEKLCLVDSFKRILNSGNKNVVAVCTVNEELRKLNERVKFTPFYLLGKEASQELEPFVPIQVENFSDMEVKNCLDFYSQRKWIQNSAALTDEGRKQIKFLTSNNPYAVWKVAGAY